MSLVVIEGVVDSDAAARGARHEVEWTDRLAALVRNGLVRVVSGAPTQVDEALAKLSPTAHEFVTTAHDIDGEPEPEPAPVKVTASSVRKRRRAEPETEVLVDSAAEEPPADTDGE